MKRWLDGYIALGDSSVYWVILDGEASSVHLDAFHGVRAGWPLTGFPTLNFRQGHRR